MHEVIALGEIMLRLSTPQGQLLSDTPTLSAHYGGGEANVAISLANFGHSAYFASCLPENALGLGVKQHLQKYGVGTDYLKFSDDEMARLGTYYLTSGVAQRASQVIYDRAYSAFSALTTDIWAAEEMFKGKTLCHISGITPALSQPWQELTKRLIKKAKAAGCLISFDVNYRAKLWSQADAGQYLQQILPLVDFCSAGEKDAKYLLNLFEDQTADVDLETCYQKITAAFPNLQVLYATKRQVMSATHHQLQGFIYRKQKLTASNSHTIDMIVDRVGIGDAFAAGILHGLLEDWQDEQIVNFATAAATLKHTIYGDTNQFSETDVLRFMAQASSQIDR